MWSSILFIGLSLACTNALECGIILGNSSKEVKQVIKTCLLPTIPVVVEKVDNSTKATNISDEDDPELPTIYGPRRGVNHLAKRQADDPENATISTTSSTTPKPTRKTTPQPTPSNDEKNDPKRCVVQCIFLQHNMLDAKGLPDHDKVSEGLLKNVENRELRDFIQDSIDDCFGQMSELVDANACGYSAKLVTCLAEKGRYNCADWPVGELPFPHNFK